jgi:hypothetical protein
MSNKVLIVSIVVSLGCGSSGPSGKTGGDASAGDAAGANAGSGGANAGSGGAGGSGGSGEVSGVSGDADAAGVAGAPGSGGDPGDADSSAGGAGIDAGGLPPCPATDDHAPKLDPVVFCENLFARCKGDRSFVIPAAYDTETKCEAAWTANTTAVSCRGYHLCFAEGAGTATQCRYAFGMGGQCAN